MKNVLIIEPSSSGLQLITNCKQMGHNVIVMTACRDDRVVSQNFLSNTTHILRVDTNDEDSAIEAALEFHENCPFDAVVPGFEYYIPLATKIASKLELSTISPETAKNVRQKHLMRSVIQEKNLRSPMFRTVDSVKEGLQCADEIGFPMVVKPISWSGSLFVKRVDNLSQLKEGLKQIFLSSFSEYGMPSARQAIMEEYLSGKEYSVEGYAYDKQITIVSITEKFLGTEPFFVEIGHITPAVLSRDVQKDIEDYVRDVAIALQISVGPFHCEIRLTEAGPVLIEIGARLAGDRICDLILYAKGVNMYQITIDSYLNVLDGINLGNMPSELQHFCGIRYFIRPNLLSYQQVNSTLLLDTYSGIRDFQIQVAPGEKVPPPTSSLGRLGYVIMVKDNYLELQKALDIFDKALVFN
jgi:biotin carboxylase